MSQFLPESHMLAFISFSTEAGRIKGRSLIHCGFNILPILPNSVDFDWTFEILN